jgi:hypothetical protein
MRAEYALVACAVGFGAAAFVFTMVNTAFFLRLKRYEHATWQSLGSPMTIVNIDFSNFAAVRAFLKSGSHRALQDSKSASWGHAVLLLDRVFLGVIVFASLVVGYVVFFVEP